MCFGKGVKEKVWWISVDTERGKVISAVYNVFAFILLFSLSSQEVKMNDADATIYSHPYHLQNHWCFLLKDHETYEKWQ